MLAGISYWLSLDDMAEFRNQKELLAAASDLQKELDSRWKSRNIQGMIDELADLEAEMENPSFWDDQELARDKSVLKSSLEKKLMPWNKLKSELADFPEIMELTIEEMGNSKETIESLSADFEKMMELFEDILMADALNSKDDNCNAIITINSGAGGTESQDWADMLLRMYNRWFDKKGYKYEQLDYLAGEEAGIKSVTLLVKGEQAFGYLKSENGVHRLVRISPFDSNKKRHTSFASVHVSPELDDSIEINIEDKDIRVDTYRASGAGGQHVNKTDSAIRITHIATGIVVQCQNERSQMKNRSTAMKMLQGRLHELEKDKQQEDAQSRSGEKKDVAWGSQIRSYVFHPYKMVKDLRTQYETGNVDGVMDGDLDPFVSSYLKSLAGVWEKPVAKE